MVFSATWSPWSHRLKSASGLIGVEKRENGERREREREGEGESMQEVQADIHFLLQHFFCLPFPSIYFCLPSSWWPKKVPFLFLPFSVLYVFMRVGLDLLLVVSHTLLPSSDICLKNIFPDSINFSYFSWNYKETPSSIILSHSRYFFISDSIGDPFSWFQWLNAEKTSCCFYL